MLIALVITALGAGGAERVLIGRANHWAAEGATVTLITFERPGTRPYYQLDPRVELCQLDLEAMRRPRWRAAWQTVERIVALRRTLRARRPEVAIAFLAKVNVMTVLASRGLRLPLIVSERNNPEQQGFSPVWVWLRRRLYGWADGLVTPSEGVLRCFPPALRAQGRVIPNTVELPAATPPRQASRKLVAVGRLVHQKGFDLLLRAFAQIADAHPDWRLVIWGEGALRAELEALRVELGLAARVDLPGLTERPGQWTEDAGLFVLSSRFESFGNVITEAMAAGLPVITTDCPWGPGEIVRHGVDGWLVAPEDVEALAEGLTTLMGDGELRARLAQAAQRNVRRFDLGSAMAKWEELIKGLEGLGAAEREETTSHLIPSQAP
jgi:glycosyltransferase involved in cell wall biosynthesis